MECLNVFVDRCRAVIDAAPERIAAGEAIPLSLAGMAIVFTSLLLISIFIGSLPHILKALGLMKEEAEPGAAKAAVPEDQIIAAIGAVLRHRVQGGK